MYPCKYTGLRAGHLDSNGWFMSGPSRHGWISVSINFFNGGTKTIKYLYFKFIAINRVGDVVGEHICQYTGPLNPNKWANNLIWDMIWNDSTITEVRVNQLLLQFMDGTKDTISAEDFTPLSGSGAKPASGGCYVATAVYGSYDCPEVWTLRRYRDNYLSKYWIGKLFVKAYYSVSPWLVRYFGKKEWFKKMWRFWLDKMVSRLQKRGYKSTPYIDREWK